MIEPTNFQEHLNHLNPSDWQRLFDLLLKLENNTFYSSQDCGQLIDGVIVAPSVNHDDVAQEFLKVINELKLAPVFDWSNWKEGRELLTQAVCDFSNLDLVTLCMLFTLIIRADRFNEGFLNENFSNGNIRKIIETIHCRKISLNFGPKSEVQKECLWLISGEVKSYEFAEKKLGISRSEVQKLVKDYRTYWKQISAIRRIYLTKKIEGPLKDFYNWYLKKSSYKVCEYCGISETEIHTLIKAGKLVTKRSRGPKLELDRKDPNMKYDNLDNLVFACYWCNNAKTDTFSHTESKEVGKVISKIWKSRIANDSR